MFLNISTIELFVGSAKTIFDCSRWIQPLNLLVELHFLELYIVLLYIAWNKRITELSLEHYKGCLNQISLSF